MGWESIVGIATRHGLDSPRIESWRGKSFHTHPDRSTQLPIQWVPGLSRRGKMDRRGIDRPPHLAPMFNREKSYTSIALWAFVACSRVNLTFTFTTTALILLL